MEYSIISAIFAVFSLSFINAETVTEISSIGPRHGSIAGHTLVTIRGTGFAKNLFNHGPGNEDLGNSVVFVSGTRSYVCDILKDGCHETQITCYTRPMQEGSYLVRVSVDGRKVPLENHCRWEFDNRCTIYKLQGVRREYLVQGYWFGDKGTILTITGRPMTSLFFKTGATSTNGRSVALRRAYVGLQECDLTDDSNPDQLYGIQLDRGGLSDNGWIKCKNVGTFIGNSNVSFIVESFGRSLAASSTYRVSGSGQLYMFQSHAEIYNISPKEGSIEGGTELHIHGNYFDKTHPAKVKVGGVPCEVQSVTITEIVCRTPPEPEKQTSYPGNRGVQIHQWHSGSLAYNKLPEIVNYTFNGSDYRTFWSPDASYYENEENVDDYTTLARGFFVPPRSGEYEFHMLSDDGGQVYFSESDRPEDKELIMFCPSHCYSYDTYESQKSKRFMLQEGKRYFYEALNVEYKGMGYLKVGVKMFKSHLTQSQSVNVHDEVQTIKIDSTPTSEIQVISFENWETQTPVAEQQRITFEMSNGSVSSQVDIKFGFAGAFTEPLPLVSSTAELKEALNDLMTLFSEPVTIQKDGQDFLLTFPAGLGDVEDIDVMVLPPGVATVTVTEETTGVADLTNVHLTLDGVPSVAISYDATADVVEEALWDMFSTRCPVSVSTSGEDPTGLRKHHFSFESEEELPSHSWGEVNFRSEPFCGRGSLKHPSYLYSNDIGALKLYMYPKMCLAYRGTFLPLLKAEYSWKDSEDEELSLKSDIPVDFVSDGRWHYTCLDLESLIRGSIDGPSSKHKLIGLEIYPDQEECFVDEVEFAVTETIPSTMWPEITQKRLSPPMDVQIHNISVEKLAESKYQVTLEPHNCAFDFPLLRVSGAQVESDGNDSKVYNHDLWTGNASVHVERTQAASAPVMGTFDLTFKDQVIEAIPADSSEGEVQSLLRTLLGMGHVEVYRSGECHGYGWTMQWIDVGGDQPLVMVNGSNLVGHNVSITSWSDVDGGIMYNVIPGEFLQTYEEKPQVVVSINNIPTACNGNCSFEWTEAQTPTVTGISPTSGSLSAGTTLTISGTGFEATVDAADNSSVHIGGVSCDITSVSASALECDVGQGPLGAYDVEVNIGGKGLAAHDSARKQFTYTGVITSIHPLEGSNSGGLLLHINGSGFSNESSVLVGGEVCEILNHTYTSITCRIPAKPASLSSSTATVAVTHPEGTLTSSDDFTYSDALTPTVTSISLTDSSVKGGDQLVISGTNLEPSVGETLSVNIDTAPAEVVNSSNTDIAVILPPHRPGSYDVLVKLSNVGYADTKTNNIPQIDYMLSVDAITPTEGSLMGGSRLTIQGEGFPANLTDSQLEVRVGENTACDVESTSANQIVCLLDSPAENHEITNLGNHPEYGRGYAWKPQVLEITAGDTVNWRWVIPDGVRHNGYAVIQVNGPSDTNTTEGGFNSGGKTPTGGFSKSFDVPGHYHYTSGPIDQSGTIEMKGVVKVKRRSSVVEEVSVQVAGFDAEYKTNSGVTISPAVTCHGGSSDSSAPNCTDNEVRRDQSSSGHFNFTFSDCLTPTVQSVEPNELFVHETVTIIGTGFSVNPCENIVIIGDVPCIVNTSTDTTLNCHMDLSGAPDVYTRLPATVSVVNRGQALWKTENMQDRSVVFKPHNAGITPAIGSLAGGTLVIISGGGFPEDPDDVEVEVGASQCVVKSTTYTEIHCETGEGTEGVETVKVSLQTNGFGQELNCTDSPCSFEYSAAVTTVVSDWSPVNITGLTNIITLTGNFSGLDQGSISISAGPKSCELMTKSDTEITCRLTDLVSGSHDLSVRISPSGLADIQTSATTVTVAGDIDTVTPNVGSINGGTEVTITGSVFDPDSSEVHIGDSKCEIVSVSHDSITCVSSAHSAEDVDVVITTALTTITGSGMYDYSEASTPVVNSVTPTSASSSGSLTLSGTGFSVTPADNLVSIGEHACNPSSVTGLLLVCAYEDLPAGIYSISVNVSGVGTATVDDGVMFQYDPTVSTVSPDAGSFGGGHLVTVSGSGFDANEGATSVWICDKPCDIMNVTLNGIQCFTAEMSGETNVDCDVTVSVNSLNASVSNAYTYDIDKTPVITSVSPIRGGTGGGTRLTISGSDFGISPSEVSVTIADVPCDVDTSESNSTSVVCVTNSIPVTTKAKVRLQVNEKGIAALDNADFEYIDQWSSPWTWGGGPLPIEGDLVVIREGQTVLLDTDTPVLKMLLIQGGSLIFDRKDVELNAEYILVTNGGLFQVGTEEEPFMQKANIKLHGHWRSQELPLYGAKTLAIREGTLELHGRPTPVTWTRLNQTAAAGSREVVLETPVNWLVGDLIVLASTGDRHSQIQNEVKEISAISPDGRTLTLNETLDYEHISVMEIIDGEEITLAGEVGLLSHSVTIRGLNDAGWHEVIEACEEGFDTGEFVTQTCFQGRFGEETDATDFGVQIIMHTQALNTGTLKARIEYIEINYAGQEFRLGRYPIHFHLLGDMQGSYVRGCGIHQTFNRAVNIHGTHNVLIEHNVVYNVKGGALFLEDGIETGNIFQYNLAVLVKSSTSLLNDDITPASFWVTNPNNTIRHNAAAGGSHFGYWYRMHEHPDGPSFTPNICPKKVPLGQFYNNSAHSFGWFGLWIFQDYFPTEGGSCSSTVPVAAVFENLFAWNCEKGAEWVDCSSVQFQGFVMVNNEKAGIEMKMNKGDNKFDVDNGGVIRDALIVGHTSASSGDDCTTKGIILPFDSGLIVENAKFINFDRSCQAFAVTSIDGKCGNLCGGWHYKTTGLSFFNSPNKAMFRWEHEGILEDLDGTLVGTAGATVLPCSALFPPDECQQQDEFSVGIDGCVCQPSVSFLRFAFNHIEPSSLRFKNALIENEHGISVVPFAFKRLTHKEGWMAVLPSGKANKLSFENAGQIVNISYDGVFYELRDNDYAVMETNVTKPPDVVNIKPGLTREMSESALSYSNNLDGDWYFNSLTQELAYLISHRGESRKKRSGGPPSLINRAVDFQVYKCYYTDCIAPVDPSKVPPADRRPDVYYLWSDASTWETLEQEKPVSGDSVVITKGYWIVADEPLPELDVLYIEGVLEFEYQPKIPDTEVYHDLTLSANYIFVKGGRFIMGWPDEPFRGQGEIILRGSHATPVFRYPEDEEGPPLGAKAWSVFGGLDLHGLPNEVQWTNLAETAEAGSNRITLDEPVDWEIGSEVVITSSSYEPWETEVFRIQGKSGDSFTLTLNDTLKFKHLGETYDIPGINPPASYKMAAQVGLLSHNIRIVGGHYNDLFEESFGARVLVGTMADDEKEYTGYARLSNVEFYHTGQEGFVATYDPRFSLAFLDVGLVNEIRPSFVKDCSFHHSFSTAIGVFGTSNLAVESNVIYHTVNHAVHMQGTNNSLVENLISLVVWPGTYNGRMEESNFDQTAGVEATEAEELIMQGNVVAGAERIAYMLAGEVCDSDSSMYTSNKAQAVLTGVGIFPDYALSADCLLVNGFTVQKAWDYGIYLQAGPSMMITNNFLVDNGLGIFTMPLGPGARTHINANKFVKIEDNTIIGSSPDFDCTSDIMSDDNHILSFSGQNRAFTSITGGKIGIAYPSFQSGSNEAPRKPWINIMAYPTNGGLMTVKRTHFASFKENDCGERSAVFSPNKGNDDGAHPVEVEEVTVGEVEPDSIVFIHRPNVGKVNPSDCVDMDCDAMKKALLKDLDGSLLGQWGAVVPESEWEWNGDPRRGLGDYRIPKVMLTDLNGDKLAVESFAPNKGIIRNSNCEYNSVWQAYWCPEVNYEMLIIESMDPDTEDRRLSPVAVLGDGYLDLINGPQDHGWCDGYTCQERISTFMVLVATGKHYDIYLSSTNPQKTRFYLLNTDNDQGVTIAVYFSNPQRLDVYKNDVYMYPKNSALDEDGEIVYSQPSSESEFLPTTDQISGTNYFDNEYKLQYFTLKGSDPVDVVISPVVVIAFNVPAMTIDEFFGEKLVDNLALFLGLDTSRIKVVNIVREESRRKREAVASVELLISERPVLDLENDTVSFEQIRNSIINITSTIVSEIQLGALGDILNITLLSAGVIEPVPAPDDPTWAEFSEALSEGNVTMQSIKIPSLMEIAEEVSHGVEGAGFDSAPVIRVIDALGELVTLLGSTSSSWQVSARLVSNTGTDNRAILIGSDRMEFQFGYANFTDLAISHSGTGYMIEFIVVMPMEANFLRLSVGPFTISSRILSARAVDLQLTVTRGQNMDVTLEVIDAWNVARANNIHWKGHTWACTIEQYGKTGYLGLYDVMESTVSINESSLVTFNNLTLSDDGDVAFTFDCVTTPDSEYSFTVYSDVISVQKEVLPPAEATRKVQIKFDENFDEVVDRPRIFSAAMKNFLLSKFDSENIYMDNFVISAGSILVSFTISGQTIAVDDTVEALWVELGNGIVLTYGDLNLQAAQYLAVDGDERLPANEEDSDSDGLHPAIIGVICILAVGLVVSIILLLLLKCTKSGRSLIVLLRSDGKSDSSQSGDFIVTDQVPPRKTLYNERSFRRLSPHSGTPSPPSYHSDNYSHPSSPRSPNSASLLIEPMTGLRVYSPKALSPNGRREDYEPQMRGRQVMVVRQGSHVSGYSSGQNTPLPEPR